MPRKRANNEGSIYKRSNGTFSVQVTLEGKRLTKTFDTQSECKDWLHKIHGQIDDGLTYSSTQLTLGEYMDSWQASTKTTMNPSTWKQYSQLIRSYLKPYLGEAKLAGLKTEHVQALYNQLLDKGVGIHAIRKLHDGIHSALETAVKTGNLTRNPSHYAKPPKEPLVEMQILDENQIGQFLLAAGQHRWEALFHLAVITGMRQMELLGLKWSDLDWNKRTLRVERQLLRPNDSDVKFSAPKTRHGKRSILLGFRTVDVLRSHFQRQLELKKVAKDKWVESGLMFTTGSGGPIHPRNLLKEYKELLKTAGLPDIRFHDLRHTAASLLLNQNVPVITVSRRLGHARASITLDIYGHLIPTMQDGVAEMIDNLVIPVPVQIKESAKTEC